MAVDTVAVALPTSELAQCRWPLQCQTVQAKPPGRPKRQRFTSQFPLRNVSANIIAWSYNKERHVEKCVGWYCELAKNIEQLCEVASPCFWRPSVQATGDGNGGRIVTRLLSNCREISVFGAHRQTRQSVWLWIGNAYSCTKKKGLFWSVYVDDIKLAGKKENINPMWKVCNEEVDLGEPTSFLDHVNLGCTQRHCETRKHIVDNCRTMFESRIWAGATEKLPLWIFLHGPTTRKVMPRSVENFFVNWRTKLLNNCTKYQLHALMTTNSEKKNWNPWEHCQTFVHKLLGNVYIWQELVDRIFYGQSTNWHVRSQNGPELVTNVQRVWSLTFIAEVNTNNIVMWETLHNNVDWDYFKFLILHEILKIRNPLHVEHCAYLEVTVMFQ